MQKGGQDTASVQLCFLVFRCEELVFLPFMTHSVLKYPAWATQVGDQQVSVEKLVALVSPRTISDTLSISEADFL